LAKCFAKTVAVCFNASTLDDLRSQESNVLADEVEFYGRRFRRLKVSAAPEQLIDGHPEAEAARQKALFKVQEWLEGEEDDGKIQAWD